MKNSNRKPWMKELKNFRFNREGTMLSETQRAQTSANSREATCVKQSSYGHTEYFDGNCGSFFTDVEFVFPYRMKGAA